MEKAIIIRYGEIGIKSPWVRNEFEKIFADNISRAILENGIQIEKISQRGARTYLWCDNVAKALKVLRRVFGVVSFSEAYSVESDIEKIRQKALWLYKKESKNKKKVFRISTRRINKKFPMKSMDVSADIGEYIIKETKAPVSMKDFEICINIEIGERESFVFVRSEKGWGGLPIGTQGKVLCYVEKEKDFLVPFLMARRGCEIIFCGKEKFKKKAEKFEKKYYHFRESMRFIEAETIGQALENAVKNRAKAIAVGDFENFMKNAEIPVFYPLMGFDEKEIEKMKIEVMR